MMMPGGQAAVHEGDHRPADDGFAGVDASFVVPDQAPAAQEPGEGPFHDPAAGQWLEAADVVRAADDVEDDSQVLGGPVGEVAGVAAVGPDPCQVPEVLLCRGQKGPGGVPVGRGCGGDLHVQEESEGVGEQVPLAAVDLMGES